MSLLRLIASFFSPLPASSGNDFRRQRPAANRPHRHFREFTVPRRLQRGGGHPIGGRDARSRAMHGIVPHAGENIP